MISIEYINNQLLICNGNAKFHINTDEWSVIKEGNSYTFNQGDIQIIENKKTRFKCVYEIIDGLSVEVDIKVVEDKVEFTLNPLVDNVSFDQIIFPGSVSNEKGYLVLPYQQGTLVDTEEQEEITLPFEGKFASCAAYVNALGYSGNNGSWLWLVNDYMDCAYQIVRDHYQHICIMCLSSLAHLDYSRSFTLYSYDNFVDYNLMAKQVRNHLEQQGHIKTLKEKVAEKPTLKQLIGSCVYHTGIHTIITEQSRYYQQDQPNESLRLIDDVRKDIQRFHQMGAGRIHLHLDGCGMAYDYHHPRFYPIDPRTGGYSALRTLIQQLHDDNDIISLHDNYHDLYVNSEDFKENEQIFDQDGNPFRMCVWAGGEQSYLTAQKARPYLERNLSYLHQQDIAMDGMYCDVFTCNPLDENFNDVYRMNRKDCAKYRNHMFDYLNENGLIASSEEVNIFALNHIDTCHYAPYPFMMRQDSKQVGYPIPFFNLIFHDCVVIPFMSDSVNGINYGLYGLLNGGIAYLKRDGAYLNTDGSFNEDKVDSKRIDMVNAIANFNECVAYAKMIRHEFVDNDPFVQSSYFDNGYKVTINLRDDSYSIEKVSTL